MRSAFWRINYAIAALSSIWNTLEGDWWGVAINVVTAGFSLYLAHDADKDKKWGIARG